ncbi:1-aminocyclopropane-1-carboxylate deaminase/D-cysteine desulfhydrase [Campylobacter sp. US33a]|uniref:1-aminocyclopropane-1-carboxylate deaminase/D-cysteine desulfhydrase n=1 Tax=Campylobacter sp. US33a TaxID=2498120 RepID=UPI001068236A|nr:1-aminocyclopropane-1-carboxylate deaminase/D-cysteine desulfhydrase [Campylobacter sp. US33a]TEY02414.1 1-aminocyclopropane-1-carboxylate deaminase/D-cysteine desulfhydrase [Campylobacter sp. US33a]
MKNLFLTKSPIQKITFKGFEFYIKRDDLLGQINGNKARKLAFYLHQNYPKNQRFISFGGLQSNALEALSIFTKLKGYKLIYFCEKIPQFLKQNPCGNYALALNNGVVFKENLQAKNLKEFALSFCKENDVFIEQGVANLNAEFGLKELAKELEIQSKKLQIDFDIFLPSGTGTSAAFLAKNSNFDIYTCACVGDSEYLKKQILNILPNFDFKNLHILNSVKKYYFAKPYLEFYELYKQIKIECNIEFDLLYDMLGLNIALNHNFSKPLLYIHQGGINGNTSMFERYKRLF